MLLFVGVCCSVGVISHDLSDSKIWGFNRSREGHEGGGGPCGPGEEPGGSAGAAAGPKRKDVEGRGLICLELGSCWTG